MARKTNEQPGRRQLAEPHPSSSQDLIDYCNEMAANPNPTHAEWKALLAKWSRRGVNIESPLVHGAEMGWA